MELPQYITPYVGDGDILPVQDNATGEMFDVTVVGQHDETVIARRACGTIIPIQGCIYRRPNAYR